jgi:hypothetical protein
LPDFLFPSGPTTAGNDGVLLHDELIKCLLYADDLVLFSTSAEGLQRQLDRLHDYCRTWLLTVNVTKTECMFVKHGKRASTPLPPLLYDGAPLNYVRTFKYVGVFFSDDGSFRAHEAGVIERSTRAMFACMSRVGRLSKNCPLYIKALLFKAYVLPVMTYGCEVIPYTKATIKTLDDLCLRYCRWAIGLPKFSNRVHTLRECGMRYLSYIINAARANYYLLLQARPASHLSTYALLHIISSPSRNGMRARWLVPLHAVLSKWSICFATGMPSPAFSDVYMKYKTKLASIIKSCADAEWEVEVIGQASLDIHTDVAVAADPLLGLLNDSNLLLTSGHAHNVMRSPSCVTYPLMVKASRVCSTRCVAPYGNACLSPRASRALALFRFGCAPLRRNIAFGTNVVMRVCPFCDVHYGARLIEDEYHVCFECPLYAQPRYLMFYNLFNSRFSFCNVDVQPLNLLASLLSADNPQHARTVGKFLCDCLAMRALARCDASEGCGLMASKWVAHVSSSDKLRLQTFISDAVNKFYVPVKELLSSCFNVTLPVPAPLSSFIAPSTAGT